MEATVQVPARDAITMPIILCRRSRVRLLRKKAVEHRDNPIETMYRMSLAYSALGHLDSEVTASTPLVPKPYCATARKIVVHCATHASYYED